MNQEAKLKLLAFLDGQLAPREGAAMEHLLKTDAEAQALQRDWTAWKQVLAAGEPPLEVPASREQYWHEIERQIDALTPSPRTAPRHVSIPWWLRLLAPVTAGAAILVAILVSLPSGSEVSTSYAEVESPLNDVGAMIFRSESEQMTVVWVDTQ